MGWGAAVGGIIGGLTSIGETAASGYAAQLSRDWQEKMRRSAYQDTVADMRDAGLNPALAYRTGPTATPGQPAMPQIADFSADIQSGVNTGIALQNATAQVQAAKAGAESAKADALAKGVSADITANTQATTERRVQQEYLNSVKQGLLLDAQRNQTSAAAVATDVNRRLSEAELPAAEAKARMDRSEFGQKANEVRRIIDYVNPITGAFRTGAR